MKAINIKNKIMLFSSLALIAGSTVAPVMAADSEPDALTNGTVNVTADSTGKGVLQIMSVPNLDFGTVKIGTDTNKDTPATTIDNPVDVSDLRATGEGWKLSVNYVNPDGSSVADSKEWSNEDGKTYGQGFTLKLPALTYGKDDSTANIGSAPTTNAVTVNDSANPIVTAAAKTDTTAAQGLGDWKSTFDKSTTTLNVPVNNTVGKYTSYLGWTLASAPQ